MSKLYKLNLSKNKIVHIPYTITCLTSLVVLKLSYNKISTLPTLKYFNKIETLYLNHNELLSVPEFSKSIKLTSVYIQNNKINNLNIDNLSKLPNLRILNISNNTIENIPSDLNRLPSLYTLDIQENKISLVNKIKPPIHLSRLYLHGNPIKDVDAELIEQSNSNLIEFISESKEIESKQESKAESKQNYIETKSLDYSNNKLNNIPIDIVNNKDCISIDLSINNISMFLYKCIEDMNNLQV